MPPTEKHRAKWLLEDVVDMLRDRKQEYNRPQSDEEFAQHLITIVRERVLEEIESTVRQKRL